VVLCTIGISAWFDWVTVHTLQSVLRMRSICQYSSSSRPAYTRLGAISVYAVYIFTHFFNKKYLLCIFIPTAYILYNV